VRSISTTYLLTLSTGSTTSVAVDITKLQKELKFQLILKIYFLQGMKKAGVIRLE